MPTVQITPRSPRKNIEPGFWAFKSGARRDAESVMNAPILPTAPWGEVLLRAARLLPAADPGALLFHEDRADLRIELLDAGNPPTISLSRTRGAAARDGHGRLIHRSDPEPEDLERLAADRKSVV